MVVWMLWLSMWREEKRRRNTVRVTKRRALNKNGMGNESSSVNCFSFLI